MFFLCYAQVPQVFLRQVFARLLNCENRQDRVPDASVSMESVRVSFVDLWIEHIEHFELCSSAARAFAKLRLHWATIATRTEVTLWTVAAPVVPATA